MRLLKKHPILSLVNNMLVDYGTPVNINYFYNFGSLAGIFLGLQIVTGIALAMHYTPHVDLAFNSIEHILRDVNNGWFIKDMHAVGASFFFIAVYVHIFRGLYYGSYNYPRQLVWEIGLVIFFLMIMTAFLGYVLPWGQMSFWAATVITNLCSAIPVAGKTIVAWLWGGFSVDNPTLNRFFSLHYLLPFVILALVLIHLIVLHEYGSNNPLGLKSYNDNIPFHPYYSWKDYYGFIVYLSFFLIYICITPDLLGHPDNFIPANSLVTPAHIVPEWYFLPFYTVLRSFSTKLGGVVGMVMSILIFFTLPYMDVSPIRFGIFRPIYQILFWLFLANYLILGYIGGKGVEYPYQEVGLIATYNHFFFFVVYLPILCKIEEFILFSKK
jgi:ubiquinol-cytochrome c reductase cytochrome b subunit